METAAGFDTSPVADRFDLDRVIVGLVKDLEDLRAGRISVDDARARADLAKQVMNGVRTVVNAQRYLEGRARPIPVDLPEAGP